MPVFVRNSTGTWVRGNNPTTLPLYVREAGAWRGVGGVWLREAGAWRQLTDYVGTPGAPTNLRIDPVEPTNYSTMTIAWNTPTTGAPVARYLIDFYRQDGSDWLIGYDTGNTATSIVWPVGPDNYYQIEVRSVSSAGLISPVSNRIRYRIGHPQQTQQVPVSSWGSPYDAETRTEHGSSELAGSPVTNSTDYNWSTQWLSAARPATQYAEGTRIYADPRSYRRVYSVKVWPNAGLPQRWWLGLNQNGAWYGQGTVNYNYLNNPAFWSNSTNVAVYSHPYFFESAETAVLTEYPIPAGFDFLTDRCTIDIAVDRLKFVNSGWRAAIAEIIIAVQDWVTTYVTQVTVAQQNNGYW